MTISNKKIHLILGIIVVMAFLLRIIGLQKSPPSLNWDEVSHGYNAYSILKSGHDEWGETLPLIFRAYGDYKLPIYIYLTAFSEYLFGLNIYSVRLVSVLAGTLIVLFTYLLTRELFRKSSKNYEIIALVAAFFVAIEPWSLFLSRGAFEANLASLFMISGFYFLFVRSRKAHFSLIGLVLFGLSVWTYNSARIFVPPMLFFYTFLYKKSKLHKIRKYKILLLPLVVFFLPMFIQLVSPAGQARFSWVSFVNDSFISDIITTRNSLGWPLVVKRLLLNRYTFFVVYFARNYISHFSPEFMFSKGGSHYQFGVPGVGLIYPVQSFFILLGLVYLLSKRKKSSWFVFGWILLSPVASSLTVDTPHTLRLIVMLPIPMMLTSLGLVTFVDYIKVRLYKAVVLISYVIVLIYLFLSYQRKLFSEYPKQYSWAFQYGHEQMVAYLKQEYYNYDYLIITKEYGEPHEFVLFFWPWNPGNYYSDSNLIRFNKSNWYWVDGFDKFYFVNSWDVPANGNKFTLESSKTVDCASKKCLLVIGSKSQKNDWREIKTINSLDGQPAFYIYKN